MIFDINIRTIPTQPSPPMQPPVPTNRRSKIHIRIRINTKNDINMHIEY